MMKVIIIGGVAGGASTAARLRRLDEKAEIILFERGEHISYANCGLPYYIGGVITDEDELLLQTPESFFNRFRVQVRVQEEVISIEKDNKVVRVRRKSDGSEYEESYDKLVLSPGAEPFVPPMEGTQLPRVFTVRNVNDALTIRKLVEAQMYQRAVVIGGGFIGLELCENLSEVGIHVTVVEAAPQIIAPYDAEMAYMIQERMEKAGIEFYLDMQAVGIREKDDTYSVQLKNGEQLFCDFVIMAIGVRPESCLAKEAGISVNQKGSIVTDSSMKTSDEDIYAIGDAAEVYNPVSDSRGMIALAGPANKQGRIVADNLVGRKSTYSGAIGSSVIKMFDLTAACTGVNERTLKQAGVDYRRIYLLPMAHAGYYPNATQLIMKLLFAPDGRVLGAQCIGSEGVEKRIDVIATTIHFGGTVQDLTELDLCYAPPYSSAKDPVNFAGYIASNVLDGTVKMGDWEELESLNLDQTVLLDVRTEEEWEEAHLSNAVHIPVDELRERLEELPKEKEILVYCQVGIRGYIACRILMQNGFNARNLSGGYGLLENIGKAK